MLDRGLLPCYSGKVKVRRRRQCTVCWGRQGVRSAVREKIHRLKGFPNRAVQIHSGAVRAKEGT